MDIILNIIFIAALFLSIYFLKALNPNSSRIKQIFLISLLFSCISNLMIFLKFGTLIPKVVLGLFVFIIGHLGAKTMTKLFPEDVVYDDILVVALSLFYFALMYIFLISLFYVIILVSKLMVKMAWRLFFKRNKLAKNQQIST